MVCGKNSRPVTSNTLVKYGRLLHESRMRLDVRFLEIMEMKLMFVSLIELMKEDMKMNGNELSNLVPAGITLLHVSSSGGNCDEN